MKGLKLFGLGLVVVLLSACQNTVEGFGKDMQRSGQEIQRVAQS